MNKDSDECGAKLRLPVALPTDLGTFLFADAGAGPGGMLMTVLSALARLGLDPWDEAGRLSSLRDPDAIGELARSLAAVPGAPLPDPAGCARRLVALLPCRAAPPLPMPSTDAGLQEIRRRAAVLATAGVLTGLAMLLAGYVAAGNGGVAAIKPSSAIVGQP